MADVLEKVPLDAYDFFAYLSCGAVGLAGADHFLSLGLMPTGSLTILGAVALLIEAYIAGHVIAQLSSVIIEKGLTNRLIGQPAEILLFGTTRTWFARLFPGYRERLPSAVKTALNHQLGTRGFSNDAEAMYLEAYSTAAQNAESFAILERFENLYGFARNMALVLAVLAVAYWVHPVGGDSPLIAPVLGVTSIVMLYRYLKFRREFVSRAFLLYLGRQEEPQGK
jgi:hypothetical protein